MSIVDRPFKFRLKICIHAILILSFGCSHSLLKRNDTFILQPGDLLFQDLDCGPFCDAIEKVTEGYREASLSHMGLVAETGHGEALIIEAVSEGVTLTPLSVFLNRSRDAEGRPKVLVGRLIPEYRDLIPSVLEEALTLQGKDYDDVFDINNDDYYCSELVYHCFLKANQGQPVFELQPMTFEDPETGMIFPAWKEYFEALNVDIPQGEPGINPGIISCSDVLHIVYAYGTPGGWEKVSYYSLSTDLCSIRIGVGDGWGFEYDVDAGVE